ncbi:hypothetical protein HDU89_003056 [Geranomyces variabilis]|nr:hypothetical protein HDU89_003056 [Geranomyces variabilis]
MVLDENADLWANPEWCDWRTRIRGCKNSDIWVGYYIIHTILAYFAGALGLLVCYKKVYQKVWKNRLSLFELVEGGIRPRAAETFVVGATIHLFLRAIYTTVILAGGFGSQAANESFHELPWHILYSSACLLSVGVIYATPRHRLASNKMRAVRLPSYTVLNVILFVFCLVPTTSLQILAALTGHARDHNEGDKAKNYNAGHYGLWSFYCWALGGVTLYFGVTLIKLLRASASPQSSATNVGAGQPKAGSSGTHSSQTGGDSSAADANGRAGFRRAVMTLIVTIGCTFAIEVAFACVLGIFAALRVQIQSNLGWSVIFATLWIFTTPLMLTPIFLTMLWSLHKSAQEQMRFRSNRNGMNSDPTASQRSAAPPPQEPREKWEDVEADRQPTLYARESSTTRPGAPGQMR